MTVSLTGRIKKNFVPPIFLKRQRVENRLAALILKMLSAKPLAALQYQYLQREVAAAPEIAVLFPEARMKQHWGYARLENTAVSPNLYVHQIRYYRMYQYFKRAYPDIFEPETAVLNIGDTSGMLFLALGKTGLSLNMRPERVDYIKAQGVDAVVGNADALQFDDNAFDYVFCFQTLEHVRGPLQVLIEMGRVARKAVFVSIPFVEQTHIWEKERFIRDYRQADEDEIEHIQDDECHVFELCSDDLKKLLSYTPLTCKENFTLDYFSANGKQTFVERLVARLTPSHFNFFVLEKRTN